jgi:WD40 repeat protein/DNA-binding SARP family transcriptional activator
VGVLGLEFRILGPLEVRVDGIAVPMGGPRQRALLALLLLSANRVVSRDRLIEELMLDPPGEKAERVLTVQVSRLRKALSSVDGSEPRLVASPPGYVLHVMPGELDLDTFERLLAKGRTALEGGDPARAAAALREGEALWRGRPLADLEFEPFARLEAERLEELRLVAVEERIEAELELGRDAALVPELEALVAEHPLQERLRGQLMVALYRAGRQADALASYRQTSELFREELGLAPSPSLQKLERSILEQDASLDGAARVAPDRAASPAVCPFKGLAFFDRADAEYFCGRERLASDVLARLVESTLVGIVGSSGIGKSSLLRAGVLPALSAGVLPGSASWRQLLLRPGEHPCEELRRALQGERLARALGGLSPGERIVIAVDQLEELFTVCQREGERAAFLEKLAEAARDRERRALVAVSLRADFYGRLASYPAFAELLSASHVLVGPMDRDELARAIEQPAARAGLEVERVLVEALVADVAGERGGLPLLSTMLLELWRLRDGRDLRYASYRISGGVRGAVARLAEGAYTQLDDEERQIARRVLLRLAADEEGALVRRRVPLSEIERLDGAKQVLVTLTDARLLTVTDGEVELSHEALLREWPRYQAWFEEDRDGIRLHRQLNRASRLWDAGGREVSDLYRGARLDAVVEWARTHPAAQNATERAFLDASVEFADRERRHQQRSNRRLRALLAAAGGLLVLAIVAVAVAISQRSNAQTEARVADAERLGAEALIDDQLDHGLLLARAGVALDDSLATRSNLLAALLKSPAAIGVLHGDGDPLYDVALSPDGRTLALGDGDGTITFFDTATRRGIPPTYRVAQGSAAEVRYSPDGSKLTVTEGSNHLVDVLDAATHRRLLHLRLDTFPGPPVPEFGLSSWIIAGSRELVVARFVVGPPFNGPPTYLQRFDARTGAPIGKAVPIGRHPTLNLLASADRRTLVFGAPGEPATYVVDATTLRVRTRYSFGAFTTTVSPDGRLVALGGEDGSVRVADLATGQVRRLQGRHDGLVEDAVFSNDDRTLVTTGDDRNVIVWDLPSGQIRETLVGHSGRVNNAVISADGSTLYTVGLDGSAIIWDLSGRRRLGQPFGAGTPLPGTPPPLAVSPTGHWLATGGLDGTVRVIDARTLRLVKRFTAIPNGYVMWVRFSPDGRLLGVAGQGGSVTMWNTVTWREAGRPLRGLQQDSQALDISGDSTLLAAADGAGNVRVWGIARGITVARFSRPRYVESLAFDPHAARIAVTFEDLGTEIIDAHGRAIARLPAGQQARAVAFSPDGRLVATGEFNGAVRLWSTTNWKPFGKPLERAHGRILTISFSPDSRTLATSSDDGGVRLWDVATQKPIGTALPGLDQHWVSAAFSPNGKQLLTYYDTGQAYRWQATESAWKEQACYIAGRELTLAEWQDVLPNRPYEQVCSHN